MAILDGIGLTMFIPLFQVIESGDASTSDLGQMGFILTFFNSLGIQLTISIVLTMLISLFLIKGIVSFFEMYISSKIQLKYIRKLRIEVLEGLCNINYLSFTKIDFGRIQNGITNEIENVEMALGSFLLTAQSTIMLLGYLVLAYAANMQFALIITIVAVIGAFVYRKTNNSIENTSLEQTNIASSFQRKFMELLMNYKYLKATNLISKYKNYLFTDIKTDEGLNMRIGKINSITSALKDPISITLIGTIVFIQIVVFEVSILSIILSIMFFYRSLTSLLSVQNAWQGFLAYSGSIHVIKKLQNDFEESLESKQHDQFLALQSNICIENVSFSFGNNLPNVLNNISLRIHKNSIVAFVGESGSGKTTIVNMLAGLILPNTGSIFIDGKILTQSVLRNYRKSIGYITQEPVVFNDTLFSNVTFGSEKTPANLIRFTKVMQQTALMEFVNNLSNKEDTLLGDNGVLISGGQKQRISIARELYRGISILFMDEATSSLDSETEGLIQESISALKGEITIVLIAHRLSTVKDADVIFLIDNGKIAASGNFETLTKESPEFLKMVKSQQF